MIFKNLNGEFKPVSAYFGEELSDEDLQKGEQPKPIYYVSDEVQQAQYIATFKDAGLDALLCDTYIDAHFISYLEYKNPKKCRFVRIDAEVDSALKGENVSEKDSKEIVELFKKYLVNQEISVKAEKFKSGRLSAVVTVDEFMRRMSEMNGFYGMDSSDPNKSATLVINLTNPIISGLLNQSEEKQSLIVNQIYYLAMISFKQLSPDELSDFVEKTSKMLFDYSK